MPQTTAICPLCEACCGLSISTEGGRVTAISGDSDDPFSRGHLCPKALALQDLYEDPDRLRRPLERTATGWRELDWPDALDRVAERIGALQAAHGADALAVYLGNPVVHNLGALLFGTGLLRALRTKQRYSATSVDQLPHMLVAHWVFGHQLLLSIPDIDRTDWMLILGANPAASNGSLMTAPGMDRRLRDLRARGGRVELIDPRRTETARLVDRHHFIRPGTDALLLAAMLQVLFAEGAADPGRLAPITDGLDAVSAALVAFSPERVAPMVGIDAATIRRLARDLAGAERGVVYGRFGVSTQRFGGLCQWLIVLLNLVTGNLDAPGGAMFTRPAIDPMGALKLSGRGGYGRWRSRVRDLPEANGELPVAGLADEITTPGEGRVRGLVVVAGNPVLSTPDGSALDAALDQLDLLVSIDPYRTETSRKAHFILPPVSPLERPHYDVVFNLLAVRNVARWSDPVFDKQPGEMDDGEILAELHERLAPTRRERLAVRARRIAGPARMVDLALRAGPYGAGARVWRDGLTLDRVRQAPHGLDLGPLEPALPDRLKTPDRRIRAAPAPLLADLSRLAASLDSPALPDGFDLQLIGRRQLRSNNSWMHNAPRLMKGRDRCTLMLHPDDAAARGLASGDRARVRSRVGAVEVPVEVTDSVMRGVVSLPHGFGHDRAGASLTVAAKAPGVSMNDLTDSAEIDELSGTAVLSGVPVVVERADPAAAR